MFQQLKVKKIETTATVLNPGKKDSIKKEVHPNTKKKEEIKKEAYQNKMNFVDKSKFVFKTRDSLNKYLINEFRLGQLYAVKSSRMNMILTENLEERLQFERKKRIDNNLASIEGNTNTNNSIDNDESDAEDEDLSVKTTKNPKDSYEIQRKRYNTYLEKKTKKALR